MRPPIDPDANLFAKSVVDNLIAMYDAESVPDIHGGDDDRAAPQ
jgi:hypothetical protein